MRKQPFKSGYYYHICNKSIASYKIFNNQTSLRFLQLIDYYNKSFVTTSFSKYFVKKTMFSPQILKEKNNAFVKIVSYCIMPDHYHILLKISNHDKFSHYINTVENAFTRYFNLKHNRKGPLWQSVFRSVFISTDEQLLHVSRYIHLNPVTNYLVEKPDDWIYSSYKELTSSRVVFEYINDLSIKAPESYKKFVNDQKDYQRKLKRIKKLLLE